MTCWIEDELHLERHSLREPVPLPLYPAASSASARVFAEMTEGMRPCSVYCQDGTHATVAFITDEVAKPEAHVCGQFTEHHAPLLAVKAVLAHEVTPEMYPQRKHRGAPAESHEKLTAWLVYFTRVDDGQS